MFCRECGAEISDKAFVCPKCGCLTGNKEAKQSVANTDDNLTLKNIAKIFLIIGCVTTGLGGLFIPFAWTIPMTISYCNKAKNNEPVSIGFKVCILLFVSLIAGVLLLCDEEK